MKLNELTPDLIEKASRCATPEERRAFIADNEIELTAEQLAAISGGAPLEPPADYEAPKDECPGNPGHGHDFSVKTGKKRPGDIFGSLWPDVEYKCAYCDKTKYLNW